MEKEGNIGKSKKKKKIKIFIFVPGNTKGAIFWLGKILIYIKTKLDFSGGSDGKESDCDAGDQGSIPGSKFSIANLENYKLTKASITLCFPCIVGL